MSNKKQLLRGVIESSNDSVKELYNYAKDLDWQQLDQRDIFDEYLDDDKFMLSVFHQIRQDSTLALEEELKQGWFDVLPFVYYDFFVMDQRYIKNVDATEKQMNKLADRRQRLTEKGNQITMQNEDKLEANKKSISKVTEEIIEKHGQIHEKYNVGVPYSIKELIFSREEAGSLLTGYKSEHRNSLITIREEYKNHLSKINKRLYWRFLQCSPYSNFDEVKGMLSWLMAGEYKSENYLYFLDEKLLLNLEGIEETEIHEQFFKFLNADRRVGAETHFRIKLLDYVIRCKRRGDVSIAIQDFNNLYTDKPNSNAGYMPAKEVDEAQNPWGRIDGTAATCINMWIENNRFTGQNDKVAKAFLTSFEIRSEEQHGKPFLGDVKPTVGKVIRHETYPFDIGEISNRQLANYLDDYWHNYRDPAAIEE